MSTSVTQVQGRRSCRVGGAADCVGAQGLGKSDFVEDSGGRRAAVYRGQMSPGAEILGVRMVC